MDSKARILGFSPQVPRKRKTRSYQPRQRPQQARAQMTYDSILDAAAQILEELGYSALTTNRVAGVAGVAVGALYAYFPNKETIVAELIRRTVRVMSQEIAEAFVKLGAVGSKEEAIPTIVRLTFQVLRKRRALMKVFVVQVPFLWEIDEVLEVPMKMFEIAWMARGITKPGIPEGDTAARTYLYLLITIGQAVTYTAIIDRPKWVTEVDAEKATMEIFKRLLA